ncbi:hypothetical protein Pcinc_012840 [Petrolisthes cinctipes]|uniref:Uncharacterized protein n=1 Tax=Petrolisthes cinctipes TaxID=88211 RepID=A0AAE1KUX8_PETCI|nr:hypothetical protein Pcinc_012840 [Petrolisthes cinctipes]
MLVRPRTSIKGRGIQAPESIPQLQLFHHPIAKLERTHTRESHAARATLHTDTHIPQHSLTNPTEAAAAAAAAAVDRLTDELQHHAARSSPVLIHIPPSSTLTPPSSLLFSTSFPLYTLSSRPPLRPHRPSSSFTQFPPPLRPLHLVSYSTTLLFPSHPLLHVIPPPSHPHLHHLVPSTSSPSPSHLLLHLAPSVLICGLSVEGGRVNHLHLHTSSSSPVAPSTLKVCCQHRHHTTGTIEERVPETDSRTGRVVGQTFITLYEADILPVLPPGVTWGQVCIVVP